MKGFMTDIDSYPTWAYDGTPTNPDDYIPQDRTPPEPRCVYPNVGCKCRQPGVPAGNPGPDFPVYYTVTRCSDTDVRVALNLFYEKDGAAVGLGVVKKSYCDTGHNLYVIRPCITHHARTTRDKE